MEAVAKVQVSGGKQLRVAPLRDVPAQRRLAGQTRQAQNMEIVGRLAGGVAHDVNNLLMVINGHSELLLKRANSVDPSLPALASIHKAGLRAAALTQHLLAFGRKQVQQKPPIWAPLKPTRTTSIRSSLILSSTPATPCPPAGV
ncbi:MAG: hypothetical protein HYZ37_00425 [Candidatus Solibacter usitatus]|nr:hypothetical protein [Candidatus Solibacter usitatus]